MDIIIYIGLALISVIPSIILYKWLKKKNKDNEEICKKAFINGIIAVFPIMLASFIFYIGEVILKFFDINTILKEAYHTFFVLAFAEELVKFLMFKYLLKKNPGEYSWFNITMFMTIVGIGFGVIENFTVSIGSSPIEMAIRGISIGHAGYGFIMGWFYGKMLKTGNKTYGVLAFLIPWVLHGLYDFGLSDELLKASDKFAFISVTLEIVCIVFVFLIIRFAKKRSKSEVYNKPVINAE